LEKAELCDQCSHDLWERIKVPVGALIMHYTNTPIHQYTNMEEHARNLYYFEEVLEKFNGQVIRSNIREATPEDIKQAITLHIEGKCPHTIVYDYSGWVYDTRICGVCGAGLGLI
jgi:hypothetical protein